MYQYNAKVIRVLDGDTVELLIDLGFTVFWKSTCRLYGINTYELHSKNAEERSIAIEAKNFVIDQIDGRDIQIKSKELDKYGRPLIDIFFGVNYELHLNEILIEKTLAVRYFGGKK
jgi:micrococcal nuclease